jgi:thioredoxin-like negative regulator of GroEL
MAVEAGVRPRRRSHLLAAAAILVVILAIGLILTFLPGSAPKLGTVVKETASRDVTPFGQTFARGVEALRLGDPKSAAVAFEQARAINPHIAEAHVNLGFAYLAMERARDAATAFDRALTINPRQINAFYGLGTALDAAGDRQGAMGAMQSYAHLAAEDDPFRRKALSALWEWEAAAKAKTEAPPQGDASKKAEPVPSAAKAAVPRNAPEAAPLPAIAQTPEALTPPNGVISIVNVWASWCGPCRKEMPSLQTFAAALNPARYRLAGLNIDSDRDFAREFIRDTGVSFGNFWDGKGVFARERYQVDSYPQTLFLDSSGTVLARIVGAREWPAGAVEATMAEILASGQQKMEAK